MAIPLGDQSLLKTCKSWLDAQVPVLGFFVQAATAAKEAAMGIYVQQQLEYGKLWKLVEFSQVSKTTLLMLLLGIAAPPHSCYHLMHPPCAQPEMH